VRVLVNEQSLVVPVGPSTQESGTVTLGTPRLRPRLQGYRTALRADALAATYVDRAVVLFTVIGQTLADLQTLAAKITVYQSPVLGTSYESTFPALSEDVSAAFQAARGKISVDLSVVGVCRVELQLVNRSSASTMPFRVQVEVFGDERNLEVVTMNDAPLLNSSLPGGGPPTQALDG